MKTDKRNFLIESGITIILIGIVASSWLLISHFWKSENKEYPADPSYECEVGGQTAIPYFLILADRSGSMPRADSDPYNYERETLKQISRLIYWNGKELERFVGELPRLQILTFSGAPEQITGRPFEWITLDSEQRVFDLDEKIDAVLAVRDGQSTDINSSIEYIDENYKKLAETPSNKPRVMVTILLSDGNIYPNGLNRVNYPQRRVPDSYLQSVVLKVGNNFGRKAAAEFNEIIEKSLWLDAHEWAKEKFAQSRPGNYQAFKQDLYGFNENFVMDDQRFRYARDEVQSDYLNRFGKLQRPDFALNVIALLKSDNPEAESYLEKWAGNFGFYKRIRQAADMSKQFTDFLADYLLSYGETSAISGPYTIGPFHRGVHAFQLIVNWSEEFLPYAEQAKLTSAHLREMVLLTSPDGREIQTKLNDNLDKSLMFYVSVEDYADVFHHPSGWTLTVTPRMFGSLSTEKVHIILVVYHSYRLDVKPTDPKMQSSSNTSYDVRLIDLKQRRVVPADDFEEMMVLEVQSMTGDTLPPIEASAQKPFSEGVRVDLDRWPAGEHRVRFNVVGGKIRGDQSPLTNISSMVDIHIGEGLWLLRNGQPVDVLAFPALDRE